jgi:hypothetical protein
VDAAPPRRGLGQRALQQILGRVLIAGQHVSQAEQLGGSGRHEVREVLPGTVLHRASPILTLLDAAEPLRLCHDEGMRVRRFGAQVAGGPGGRGVIPVPFDPDQAWGVKADHPVIGRVNGKLIRGRITPEDGGWSFAVTPMWMRDAGLAAGDDVTVELNPEGPQRGDLADDIAAALEANPAAAAFFDTLAQFYRKAYLRWIDATTRRPELRAARIAEVVDLLAAGIKQRPR